MYRGDYAVISLSGFALSQYRVLFHVSLFSLCGLLTSVYVLPVLLCLLFLGSFNGFDLCLSKSLISTLFLLCILFIKRSLA